MTTPDPVTWKDGIIRENSTLADSVGIPRIVPVLPNPEPPPDRAAPAHTYEDVRAALEANRAKAAADAAAAAAAQPADPVPFDDPAEILEIQAPSLDELDAWLGDIDRLWSRLARGRVVPRGSPFAHPQPEPVYVRIAGGGIDIGGSVVASLAAAREFDDALALKPAYVPLPRPPAASWSGPQRAIAHATELLTDLRQTLATAVSAYTEHARAFRTSLEQYHAAVDRAQVDFDQRNGPEAVALRDAATLRQAVRVENARVEMLRRAAELGVTDEPR